jgi:hypothetical protein
LAEKRDITNFLQCAEWRKVMRAGYGEVFEDYMSRPAPMSELSISDYIDTRQDDGDESSEDSASMSEDGFDDAVERVDR